MAVQAATIAPRAREEVVIYIVRRGDTLDRLSRSFLVPERRWRALLSVAGVRRPTRLPIGWSLAIPRSWLRYKVEPARLASYRGTVSLSLSGRPLATTTGMTIGEGTDVATAGNSFVTLTLADRSQIVIPSQSRVRVRELRRILLTGAIDYRIEVQRGRLETKVAPLGQPEGRYRIQTPISMTAVRGTEFRVSYESLEGAGTEVLSGHVAFGPTESVSALLVDRSFGATLSGTGGPRIEPLLPAPDLQNPPPLQTRDAVEFAARPVSGVARYRAVIAADAGFVENIAEQISDTGVFSLSDIPNGNLFVRISAVAPSGLEGLAQAYSFRRRLASIHGTIEEGDNGYRFRWTGAGEGVRRYRFQLMRGQPAGPVVIDEVALTRDELTLRNLAPGVYFWRVGLIQIEGDEITDAWTDPEKLTITNAPRRRPT